MDGGRGGAKPPLGGVPGAAGAFGSMSAIGGIGAGAYVATMEALLGDYMERLGSRLCVLETELRYAWRALDMLSQEYVKMWERLEKLEILLFEQQAVIGQLLQFYTASDLQSLVANKSAAAATAAAATEVKPVDNATLGSSDNRIPDEAFYRSLNTAHRDNLSQVPEVSERDLSPVWLQEREARSYLKERERERGEEKEKIFPPAGDYRLYDSSTADAVVEDKELQELQKYSNLDKVARDKLRELDTLSAQLLKDSQNLRDLRDRLLASPKPQSSRGNSPKPQHVSSGYTNVGSSSSADIKNIHKPGESIVDEKLRQLYHDAGLENWEGKRTESNRNKIISSSDAVDSNSADTEVMNTLGIKSTLLLSGQRTASPRDSEELTNQQQSPRVRIESPDTSLRKGKSETSAYGRKTPDPLVDLDRVLDGTLSQQKKSPGDPRTSNISVAPERSKSPKCFESYKISSGDISISSHRDFVATSISDHRITSPRSPKSPRHINALSPVKNSEMGKYDSGISTLSSTMSTSSSIEKSPTSPRTGRHSSQYKIDRQLDISQMSSSRIKSSQNSIDPVAKSSKKHPLYSVLDEEEPGGQSILDSFQSDSTNPFRNVESQRQNESDFNIYENLTSDHVKGNVSLSAPTSSTYSQYYTGSRSSAASSMKLSKTETSASNLMGTQQSLEDKLSEKHRSLLEKEKIQQTPFYNAAGELKIISTLQQDFENGKLDPRHSLTAESSDSISSYSSSSSFYPSSGTGGGKEKYTKYPPTTSQSTTSHTIVNRYIPVEESKKHQVSQRYKQYNVDPNAQQGQVYHSGPENYLKNYSNKDQNFAVAMNEAQQAETAYATGQQVDPRLASVLGLDSSSNSSQSPRRINRHDRHSDQRRHTQMIHGIGNTSELNRVPVYQQNQAEIHQSMDPSMRLRFNGQDGQSMRTIEGPHEIHRQGFSSSDVLVSESGYISITQGSLPSNMTPMKQIADDKRKVKRVSSMKTAFTQVSKIMPNMDIIGKRSRSHSLPSRSFTDDPINSEEMSGNISKRKDKRKSIRSTVTGLLHKTRKRGSNLSLRSLSDSEQSDLEISHPIPHHSMFREEEKESINLLADNAQLPESLFATVKQATEANRDVSNESVKSPDKDLSVSPEMMFETVGDIKRSDSREADMEPKTSVASRLSGGSREFAVSRALGKYRQRQSGAAHSDDQSGSEEAMRASSSGSDSGSRPPSNHQILSPPLPEETAESLSSEYIESHGKIESATIIDNQPSSVNNNNGNTRNVSAASSHASSTQDVVNRNIVPNAGQYEGDGQIGINKMADSSHSANSSSGPLSLNANSHSNALIMSSNDKSHGISNLNEAPRYRLPKNSSAPAPINESISKSSTPSEVVSTFNKPTSQKVNINILEEAGVNDASFDEALFSKIIQNSEESYKRSPPENTGASLYPQRTSEDDDCRSMRSYRSSRMSSRRQSTEDSIDSDDEWYRYEIRKLELQETTQWKDINPADCYPLNPDETIRRRMTVVLCELQGKIPRAPASDELPIEDPRLHGSTLSLEPQKDIRAESPLSPAHIQLEKMEDECSSGDTSGPDSPDEMGDESGDERIEPEVEESKPANEEDGAFTLFKRVEPSAFKKVADIKKVATTFQTKTKEKRDERNLLQETRAPAGPEFKTVELNNQADISATTAPQAPSGPETTSLPSVPSTHDVSTTSSAPSDSITQSYPSDRTITTTEVSSDTSTATTKQISDDTVSATEQLDENKEKPAEDTTEQKKEGDSSADSKKVVYRSKWKLVKELQEKKELDKKASSEVVAKMEVSCTFVL